MASYKPLSKQDILRAMKMTKSNHQASRYLNVSYQHFSKFAKIYFDENGKSFFEKHKNPSGKGIPKFMKTSKNDADLNKILSGELWVESYSIDRFKARLIHEHIIAEECGRCGFNERRVIDYKVPVLLNFIDTNKKNWRKENLEFLCYNCYFLTVGEVFDSKEVRNMEDFTKNDKRIEPMWELDENAREHLKSLGILDEEEEGLEFRDYKDY